MQVLNFQVKVQINSSTSCNSWVSRLIYKIMPDKWINKDDQSRYVKLSNMIFYTLVLSKFKLLWQLVLTACPALFSIVGLSFLRRLVCNMSNNHLLRRGGGFLGIWRSALMGCRSASGGAPSAISIMVMPRDHTSLFPSYSASCS